LKMGEPMGVDVLWSDYLSAVLHAIRQVKPRLFGLGGVANLREPYGYRCGLRLAMTKNSSVLYVPSSMQNYTSFIDERFEP
jgi:hypothetical protein